MTWQEKFDKQFYFLVDNNDKHKESKIKSFIAFEIQKAREETLKELLEKAKPWPFEATKLVDKLKDRV